MAHQSNKVQWVNNTIIEGFEYRLKGTLILLTCVVPSL